MKKLSNLLLVSISIALGFYEAQAQGKTSDYYQITDVNVPENIVLEVGGIAFDDQGRLGAITRRGELWLISNPESVNPTFSRFAHGLHEPLGLSFRDGYFYANQRGELTKIRDTDGDGKADVYETIVRWDLNGNYHEYSYGPVFLPDGDMLVTLNLGWIGRGESGSKWRGWMLKVTEEGELTPYATGLRSPAGFGLNDRGDIFYTENQGDWVGSGRMTHLELGDFAGNPEGLKWSQEPGSPIDIQFDAIDDSKNLTLYEYQDEIPAVKPPSVWFPHTLMGISTSGFKVFNDKMGPFSGQLMVGDQGHSKIMRVFQEKVNGVYQGICFPFVDGFASGVLRLTYSPDGGSIYVGQTNRGWASTGREPFALQRLKWTGKIPFDMKAVRVTESGFEIEFTQPVDKEIAADPTSYQITDFTYLYHHFYGSPVQEKEDRVISLAEVSEDGLKVRLSIDKFRKGFVYEIKAPGVQNRTGTPLLNTFGYYTLNEVPVGSSIVSQNTDAAVVTSTSALRVTELPESWDGIIDNEIEIGTLPGLKYDKTELTVKAGDKVKITFNNTDDMPHNILFVNPGKADEVGEAAMNLGLDGENLNYVPKSNEIIAHSNLVPPTSTETIYFVAPTEPGEYQYVCTFPGHHTVMRGILKVLPKEAG